MTQTIGIACWLQDISGIGLGRQRWISQISGTIPRLIDPHSLREAEQWEKSGAIIPDGCGTIVQGRSRVIRAIGKSDEPGEGPGIPLPKHAIEDMSIHPEASGWSMRRNTGSRMGLIAPRIEQEAPWALPAPATDEGHGMIPDASGGTEAVAIPFHAEPLITTDQDGIAAMQSGPGFLPTLDPHHLEHRMLTGYGNQFLRNTAASQLAAQLFVILT
jgi:hypothetical protein